MMLNGGSEKAVIHVQKHEKVESYAFFGWLLVLFVVLISISHGLVFNQVVFTSNVALLLISIFIKFTIRNLFLSMPVEAFRKSSSLRDKVMNLLEHVVFSVWAYIEIVIIPEVDNLHGSWLLHPRLCWTLPAMPSSGYFWLFYIAKTGTHVEDCIYMVVKYSALYNQQSEDPRVIHSVDLVAAESDTSCEEESSTPRAADPEGCPVPLIVDNLQTKKSISRRDAMMDVHHVVTALLCIVSYATGYVKIGSVVMLLHDISDIPLDMLRIAMAMKWELVTMASYVALILNWVYWRFWILSLVLKSIVFDAQKSFFFPCHGSPSECAVGENMERAFFVGVLGVLLVLHVVWFYQILRKGYRQYMGDVKNGKMSE